MDVIGDDILELDVWEFDESLSWEESIFEDGFISSVEDDGRAEKIDMGLHTPYELDDSFCDNIYTFEEEELEWERLRKNHERLLKKPDKLQHDLKNNL